MGLLEWKSSDGLKIVTRLWQPVSQVNAVVCLLHGIGEHTGRFEHVGKAFGLQGIALIGSDWRGHGLSDGKRGYIPSINVVLDDIDLLILKAKELYPGIQVFLYGQSLGGILALYYTLMRRPEISGVIVTSPALLSSLDKQPFKIAIAKVLGRYFPSLSLHSGLDPIELSRDHTIIDKYINDPLVHYHLTLGFGRILISIRKWMLLNSAEFPLPLLLMHGTNDTIAYVEGSKQFAREIKARCQLVLWEGALHELHNEPEKDKVIETIVNWINKISPTVSLS